MVKKSVNLSSYLTEYEEETGMRLLPYEAQAAGSKRFVLRESDPKDKSHKGKTFVATVGMKVGNQENMSSADMMRKLYSPKNGLTMLTCVVTQADIDNPKFNWEQDQLNTVYLMIGCSQEVDATFSDKVFASIFKDDED